MSEKTGPEILMPVDAQPDEPIRRRVRKLSRRGFLAAGAAAVAGGAGYQWLRTRPNEEGIPWPLRRMHELNEKVSSTLSSPSRLSSQYPRTQARMPKVNGVIGLTDDLELEEWRLHLLGVSDPDVPIILKLDEVKALPRVEIVTRLFCIEGWSEVVHWGGARLVDLVTRYPQLTQFGPGGASYVSAQTPDEEYFVGLDIESVLHPQTLLCYEMNGQPLELEHGAPLRLVLPHKYGIKSLKCLGTLAFVNQRPDDYWALRGYDYYSGL